MANTYTAIATVTVGSGGAANIEFTSIPGTYTDLVVKISGRGNASALYESFKVNLNGSTANWTSRGVYGLGNSDGTESNANPAFICGSTATANTFSSVDIYIPNYTSSNNKSVSVDSVTESNTASGVIAYLAAGLYSNTSVVTSITFTFSSANSFVQYTTATLYGIKKD
jgi:hypothetical protein